MVTSMTKCICVEFCMYLLVHQGVMFRLLESMIVVAANLQPYGLFNVEASEDIWHASVLLKVFVVYNSIMCGGAYILECVWVYADLTIATRDFLH